jgi:hypothetical protein
MAAYRSSGPPELGAVLSRHFPRRWTWKGWLFAGSMFVSAAVTAVGAPSAKDIDSPDRYIVAAVSAVVALVVVGLALLGLRRRGDEIRIHDLGFVLRWNAVETAFRWDTVVACCTRPAALPGAPKGRRFAISLRDGSHRVVPPPGGFFDDISETGFERPMREAIERVLVRSVRAAYEKGEPLVFGKFEAQAQRGLSCAGHVLPWSEMGEPESDSEFDLVHLCRRPSVKWATIDPGSTPNFDLLFLLVVRRGTLPPEP